MVILHRCDLPTEGVRHKEIQTNAFVENRDFGAGTLYVTENHLIWVSNDGRGFSLDYPSISIHAISKDVSSFPSECIYLMAEASSEETSNEQDVVNGDLNEETNEEDNANESRITEIRFVPVDKSSLEPIFQAMSDCQTLHPDENDSFSDDDGEEGGSEYFPAPIGTSEVEFDEHGQVVYQQSAVMRGVIPVNVEEMGNGNGHDEEDEAMELGQFEDAPEK